MATPTTACPANESDRCEISVHLTSNASAQPAVLNRRVLIVPWGTVESRSGSFVVDAESGQAVLEALTSSGVDLPVDYEHQTLGGEFASPSGQAPAAGWIRRIEVVEGTGLFAEIEWTPAAMERLARREYRYLSPVALVRKSDRKLVGLHSVALTNKPAIVGMHPIVNRIVPPHCQETGTMNENVEALCQVVELDPSSELDTVLVAAKERIALLMQELARRDAADRVVQAMQAGKLTEAQREWAVLLAMKDPEAFERWESTAPVVVAPGRIEPPAESSRRDSSRRAVIASARTEFFGHPELERLTSEDAFVLDALRQAGLTRHV